MVECESHLKTYSKVDKCVLIDTWWNVNLAFGSEVSTEVPVLIDTWWNVNKTTDTKNCRWCKCFNRYMVECE